MISEELAVFLDSSDNQLKLLRQADDVSIITHYIDKRNLEHLSVNLFIVRAASLPGKKWGHEPFHLGSYA